MKTPASLLMGLSLLLIAVCAVTLPGRSETNQTAAVFELATSHSKSVAPAIKTCRVSPPRPSNPDSQHSINEIVRLTLSGIDESVVLAFVETSDRFDLSALQIDYLIDCGVSQRIIQAMLTGDRQSLLPSPQTEVASQTVASKDVAVHAVHAVDAAPRQDRRISPAPPAAADPTNTATDSLAEVTTILKSTSFITLQTATLTEPAATGQIHLSPNQVRQTPPTTEIRRVYYPVREPYPVELTAPIVFLEGPDY